MTHEIKTQWEGNMLFNADSLGGNFKIDAAEESGGQGKGLRPKALMLSSLAGCTGNGYYLSFEKNESGG